MAELGLPRTRFYDLRHARATRMVRSTRRPLAVMMVRFHNGRWPEMSRRAASGTGSKPRRWNAETTSPGEGVDAVALGERISFEQLFTSESSRLFGALCLITRDAHEAEDIGQEAFVRVLERWDKVGAMVDPAGYLYRVAMNVFRSRYRKARVATRRLFWRGSNDEITQVDDRDAVSRLLGTLTPRQRAALVLTTVLDYSSDEAGQILGIPSSSVRVLTTRARATLRNQPWEAG